MRIDDNDDYFQTNPKGAHIGACGDKRGGIRDNHYPRALQSKAVSGGKMAEKDDEE